jgi:hypothetical protein
MRQFIAFHWRPVDASALQNLYRLWDIRARRSLFEIPFLLSAGCLL